MADLEAMLGALEDLGEEDVDLLGAATSNPRLRVALANARANRQAEAAGLVNGTVAPGVPRPGIRRLCLPLGTATIAGAAVGPVNLAAVPTIPMRCERLIIEQQEVDPVTPTLSAGASVQVLDVSVGQRSQFAGVGAAPVAAFGPNSQDVTLKGDVMTPGVPVTVQIAVSVAPGAGAGRIFTACIIGEAVA